MDLFLFETDAFEITATPETDLELISGAEAPAAETPAKLALYDDAHELAPAERFGAELALTHASARLDAHLDGLDEAIAALATAFDAHTKPASFGGLVFPDDAALVTFFMAHQGDLVAQANDQRTAREEALLSDDRFYFVGTGLADDSAEIAKGRAAMAADALKIAGMVDAMVIDLIEMGVPYDAKVQAAHQAFRTLVAGIEAEATTLGGRL